MVVKISSTVVVVVVVLVSSLSASEGQFTVGNKRALGTPTNSRGFLALFNIRGLKSLVSDPFCTVSLFRGGGRGSCLLR